MWGALLLSDPAPKEIPVGHSLGPETPALQARLGSRNLDAAAGVGIRGEGSPSSGGPAGSMYRKWIFWLVVILIVVFSMLFSS